MKVLLIHPGVQHAGKLAQQLYRQGLLYKFVTGFALSRSGWLHRILQGLLPSGWYKKISNRVIDIPANYLVIDPLPEWRALRSLKKGSDNNQVFFHRNEVFQKRLSKRLLAKADIWISFDTCSWLLVQQAAVMNKPFILDLSIAHSLTRDRIFNELAAQHPHWLREINPKDSVHIALERAEQEGAAAIVAASSFSKYSLMEHEIDARKIFVNPYGVHQEQFRPKVHYPIPKKVRFIFVGRVDARKGVAWLLETLQQLPTQYQDRWILELVGVVTPSFRSLIESYQLPQVEIVGKLPHIDIPQRLRQSDVFIFPSFFEGYGLVIPEAMRCGLPIITTTHTCGPDVLTDGIEGWVIRPGNTEGLQKAIRFFLDHPQHIATMGQAASQKATQLTWDAYGNRWKKILEQVLHG